jgi:glycosyltransferase involved in cell wall biosynthesis
LMATPRRLLLMAHARWYNAEVQYALDLAFALAQRGHHVGFFGLAGSPGVVEARRGGLEVTEDRGFNAKGLRVLEGVPAALRLQQVLRRNRYDAVEVHRPEGLPLVAWACRRAGVPVVRVRGDMRPVHTDPLNRMLYTRLLAGVVATNTAIERSLRRAMPGLPRLTTIPGGVDPGTFRPEGPRADARARLHLPSDAFLVGILGRLGAVKGHGDFLEAAWQTLAAESRAAFVILTKEPTPREAELRKAVAQDDLLRGRVGFLGHCEDLPAVLRCFDLGVVASTGSEANCRVGLEWMASGVALLATRVGVLPDLVEEGETGYLVAPRSPSSLAEKILYLVRHPTEARRLGERARKRVACRFTLEHCAGAHEGLLDQIFSESRP